MTGDGEVVISEDRRQRQPGIYFTRKQFLAWALVIFASVTSAQLAINAYALRALIHEDVATEVGKHNGDGVAHAVRIDQLRSEFAVADQRLAEVVKEFNKTVGSIDSRLSNIEGQLAVMGRRK